MWTFTKDRIPTKKTMTTSAPQERKYKTTPIGDLGHGLIGTCQEKALTPDSNLRIPTILVANITEEDR